MKKNKRTCPENRDPAKRLESRRAFYQRNKVRINKELRDKKMTLDIW